MLRTQFLYSNAAKPAVLRNVVGRVPLQFKNFMMQEIAFIFSLRGVEIPRFLLATFLLAGGLGIPGADLLDWLLDLIADFSPIEEAKRLALLAQIDGEIDGTLANVLLRGLPVLFGTDLSGRIGMGDKFLPLEVRDFKGAWWSTIENASRLGEKNATIADHLRNLSTGLGAPLKALETAANGLPLQTVVTDPEKFAAALGDGEARYTSPWKNGNLEFRPTTGELAFQAVGGRPLRQTQLSDVGQIVRRDEERTRKTNREYLNRIVNAFALNDDAGERNAALREILREAEADGVVLSKQQIKRAVEDAERSRGERLLRQTRGSLRPEVAELLEGAGAP